MIAHIAPAIPLESIRAIGASDLFSKKRDLRIKFEQIGGGGVYPYELAKAMSSMGIPVSLLIPAPSSSEYQIDDTFKIIFAKAKYFPPFSLANPLPIFNPSLIKRFSILHLHQYRKILSMTTAIVGSLSHRKIFVTDHAGHGLFLRYGQIVDGFLPVSKYSANAFAQYGKGIRVIYGGVDLNKFDNTEDTPEISSPVLEKSVYPTLLYIGRIRPLKRIEDLIAASCILLRKGYRHRLLICGGHDQEPQYYNFLRSIIPVSLRDHIIFLGHCSEAFKVQLYLACDIFVNPSSHEFLSLACLEANAASKPVVATRIGGIPEIIIDGENGLLVEANEWRKHHNPGVVHIEDLAEKIRVLIEDEKLRKRLGARGRARVEKEFTWTKVAERSIKAYKDLY